MPAHEALVDAGAQAWRRGNAHSLLLRREPVTAWGPITERATAQAMASLRTTQWRAAAAHGDARMARTVIAGAGMALEAWHWGGAGP